MKLVGITGPIGHGKSTVANLMESAETKSVHLESFYLIAEVAEQLHSRTKSIPSDDVKELNEWLAPLPEILKNTVSYECSPGDVRLTQEHIDEMPLEYDKLFLHLKNLRGNPGLLKLKITDANKSEFRPILQWIGGYFAKKIDPGIWYNELVARAQKAARSGAKLCIIGGVRFPTDAEIIKEAGGIVVKVFRPQQAQIELSDMTERERDSIQTDCTLINDGTLVDLKTSVKKFVKDLNNGSLQAKYQASKK